uniref:Large ribosomal subunit protein bL27m n=1 Tax=Callorhinchus milii TaxID=7868 RepID=A0A4W3GAP6_CALMI
MAALVASLGSLQLPARLGFLTSLEPWLVSLRCASKKSSGASKNRGGNSPGKRYGWKKLDGDFVHTGNILATQRLIRWHPGANVGMGRRKTLFALEDGVVRYTKEVYVPPPAAWRPLGWSAACPGGPCCTRLASTWFPRNRRVASNWWTCSEPRQQVHSVTTD